MRVLRRVLVISALVVSHLAIAADKPFTGVFRGEGRACYGALFVRTKTIEWNAGFFKCGPARHELLEQNLTAEHPKVVFKIDDPRRQCGLAVIELEYYNAYFWEVKGYPSVEAYQKRDLPGWKDSMLPNRAVTSCGMRKE
jgi:hypothetical protein